MKCKLCEQFYKKYPLTNLSDGEVGHKLSDVVSSGPIECAFKNEEFSSDNWSCETMAKLRHIANIRHQTRRDDMCAGSFGWLHVQESDDQEVQRGYLVMAWYKDRGTTYQAYVLNEGGIEKLTLKTAEFLIDRYKI